MSLAHLAKGTICYRGSTDLHQTRTFIAQYLYVLRDYIKHVSSTKHLSPTSYPGIIPPALWKQLCDDYIKTKLNANDVHDRYFNEVTVITPEMMILILLEFMSRQSGSFSAFPRISTWLRQNISSSHLLFNRLQKLADRLDALAVDHLVDIIQLISRRWSQKPFISDVDIQQWRANNKYFDDQPDDKIFTYIISEFLEQTVPVYGQLVANKAQKVDYTNFETIRQLIYDTCDINLIKINIIEQLFDVKFYSVMNSDVSFFGLSPDVSRSYSKETSYDAGYDPKYNFIYECIKDTDLLPISLGHEIIRLSTDPNSPFASRTDFTDTDLQNYADTRDKMRGELVQLIKDTNIPDEKCLEFLNTLCHAKSSQTKLSADNWLQNYKYDIVNPYCIWLFVSEYWVVQAGFATIDPNKHYARRSGYACDSLLVRALIQHGTYHGWYSQKSRSMVSDIGLHEEICVLDPSSRFRLLTGPDISRQISIPKPLLDINRETPVIPTGIGYPITSKENLISMWCPVGPDSSITQFNINQWSLKGGSSYVLISPESTYQMQTILEKNQLIIVSGGQIRWNAKSSKVFIFWLHTPSADMMDWCDRLDAVARYVDGRVIQIVSPTFLKSVSVNEWGCGRYSIIKHNDFMFVHPDVIRATPWILGMISSTSQSNSINTIALSSNESYNTSNVFAKPIMYSDINLLMARINLPYPLKAVGETFFVTVIQLLDDPPVPSLPYRKDQPSQSSNSDHWISMDGRLITLCDHSRISYDVQVLEH